MNHANSSTSTVDFRTANHLSLIRIDSMRASLLQLSTGNPSIQVITSAHPLPVPIRKRSMERKGGGGQDGYGEGNVYVLP